MKYTYILSALLVVGLSVGVTPGRIGTVTDQARVQRKIVITGVDVGRSPTSLGDALVYPNSNDGGTDSYGYVAYDRSNSLMLVVGQSTQQRSSEAFSYALVDVAAGRLVYPATTVDGRVFAVGIDSRRQRAYFLLVFSTGLDRAHTVFQSINLRTGKMIARRATYYQIIPSIFADTTPINRIEVDPQSGNLFARMLNGDTPGLVELGPDGRTITGRKFQSSPGSYSDTTRLVMNGPGHQLVALVGQDDTLDYFDTRTLKSFIRPLGYAPVKLTLDARHNRLWALAPGGDIVVYNAITGGVVSHIVNNDASFDKAINVHTGPAMLPVPVLVIDATRGVGYIGCRSNEDKGCSVDALYPDKRGRVSLDRGPVQLLGVNAGVRVEQDPPYTDYQHLALQSFVHIYAPGRAPRTLGPAPIDRMDPSSMSEFMANAVGVTRIVWLGRISGHNGLTGGTLDDGVFIDSSAG